MSSLTVDRNLVVKGCAGLGNRLLTAASALEYAWKTNRRLFIDWEDGQYGLLGKNSFYDHFRIEGGGGPTAYSEVDIDEDVYPQCIRGRHREIWNHLFVSGQSNLLRRFPSKLLPRGRASMIHGYWHLLEDGGRVARTSDREALRSIFNANAIPLGGNYSTGIAATTVFYADYTPAIRLEYLKRIVPVSDLLAKIDLVVAEHGLQEDSIALHIRMSDKKPDEDQKLSGLIAFINSRFSGRTVFLATDNSNIETFLRDALSARVVTTCKYLPELGEGVGLHELSFKSPHLGSDTILAESIVDLWVLSRCEYLFYQGNSAFSGISRLLHRNQEKCFDWQSLKV